MALARMVEVWLKVGQTARWVLRAASINAEIF
jgi:hypothetical protein